MLSFVFAVTIALIPKASPLFIFLPKVSEYTSSSDIIGTHLCLISVIVKLNLSASHPTVFHIYDGKNSLLLISLFLASSVMLSTDAILSSNSSGVKPTP